MFLWGILSNTFSASAIRLFLISFEIFELMGLRFRGAANVRFCEESFRMVQERDLGSAKERALVSLRKRLEKEDIIIHQLRGGPNVSMDGVPQFYLFTNL